jgi:hypothetical protein
VRHARRIRGQPLAPGAAGRCGAAPIGVWGLRGCTAEDQRTILAQACLVIWHLTAGEQGRRLYLTHLAPPADGALYRTVLDTMTRLCPEVIAAAQGYIITWGARFRQDGWHPTPWAGCCEGVHAAILEVFVNRHAAAGPGGLRGPVIGYLR